jgi:hypothetical protein
MVSSVQWYVISPSRLLYYAKQDGNYSSESFRSLWQLLRYLPFFLYWEKVLLITKAVNFVLQCLIAIILWVAFGIHFSGFKGKETIKFWSINNKMICSIYFLLIRRHFVFPLPYLTSSLFILPLGFGLLMEDKNRRMSWQPQHVSIIWLLGEKGRCSTWGDMRLCCPRGDSRSQELKAAFSWSARKHNYALGQLAVTFYGPF